MDKRPKRYKEIDNPYVLESISEESKYFVKFKNINGEYKISVSKDVFEVFDESERKENNEISRKSKYIHKYDLTDEALSNKMINKQATIEDIIINEEIKNKLHKTISELSEIQKRRIIKYYFEDKTLEEIAMEEKCSKVAVKYTIDIALEKISKKFKN